MSREWLGAGGEGDYRGWDGWMASPTWCSWVWVNSGSWWWTGRPDMLWFMGSQRVRHDWAIELNWLNPSCLFILFMGFSRKEYWSGLPFLSPVDHIFSELSTMTRPSWVALLGMAHSFIELDKAVIHLVSLVHFLWLGFSFCLPSDE